MKVMSSVRLPPRPRGSGLAPIPGRSQVATVRKRVSVCGNLRPRMIARFAAVILACLSSASIAAAQAHVSSKPDLPARNTHADPLRGGWYPWDPYQYRDYRRGVPVLTGFDVEIERALERKVWLKSGGYLVFDQAEALTAIDVNTGRFVGKRNQDETV